MAGRVVRRVTVCPLYGRLPGQGAHQVQHFITVHELVDLVHRVPGLLLQFDRLGDVVLEEDVLELGTGPRVDAVHELLFLLRRQRLQFRDGRFVIIAAVVIGQVPVLVLDVDAVQVVGRFGDQEIPDLQCPLLLQDLAEGREVQIGINLQLLCHESWAYPVRMNRQRDNSASVVL